MQFFSNMLGSVMAWCYSFLHNYGLAIIVFTFFTKIILLPVSAWIQKNSIKMVEMYPEINHLKAKYFYDKDKYADEQSKLYKKKKYNPFTSLISLIIQIVLLMGVVDVIYHPLTYIAKAPKPVVNAFCEIAAQQDDTLSSSSNYLQLAAIDQIQNGKADAYVQLEQTYGTDAAQLVSEAENLNMHFLFFNLSWIATSKGGIAILVPLLAALSSWLLSICENHANVLQHEQGTGGQLGAMALSVGLSLYLGFFVPAGVGLYWVASNLLAILQQYLLNAWINPKKYVDYKALEESREELAAVMPPKTKHRFNDPLMKRERADYKRFMSVQNKHLVFYSESNGFYKYYDGMIDYILKNTNIPIHYITSDPNDHIFQMSKENPQIKAYFIDMQSLITLMMKMDADVVCMTMPDLDTYQIKRSYVRKDIRYINLCHGIGSYNLTFRTHAVDHFDSVFLAGKHQVEEIRKIEKLYGLPEKTLVECGYPILDEMQAQYRSYLSSHPAVSSKKTVMIAPSWQKGNIVESCLSALLEALNHNGYRIIVRPHPQHVRHFGPEMEALKQKYKDNPDIEIQTDFTSNSTVFEADAMISDWSSIAYEFAFTTQKPVLFVNTPMKVMNPDYQKIDTVPFDIWVRNVIGTTVEPDHIEEAPEKIAYLFSHLDEYRNKIKELTAEYVYNLGSSAEVGAREIIREVFSQTERRQANNDQ